MSEYFFNSAWALWLGLLTSMSPCPLATNVAAVSFVGRQVQAPRGVMLAGAAYTLGRMLTYLALGAAVVASLLSIPVASQVLQSYMNKLLGPLLVLVGMFLLGMLEFRFSLPGLGRRLQEKAENWGLAGALALGVLFALSFCPVSAALFFGSLIPLAIHSNSAVMMPSLFGIGTGLPVLLFAVLLAWGTQSIAKVFDKVQRTEAWARRITGVMFIGIGIVFSMKYIFEV